MGEDVQSETAGGESPLHTPGGGYFYFWVGPLDPSVHAVIGTRVWFGEPTRCAMKMLP